MSIGRVDRVALAELMIKLHLGCFDVPLAGWYNTDITLHIVVARIPFLPHLLRACGLIDELRFQQHKDGVFRKVHYLNALKRFPFPDNSVEAVYSSCMLGCLTRQQALESLSEVNRVLRPGGVFRVATPNLNRWIVEYNPDKFLCRLFEPEIKGEKNRVHWMYTPSSLQKILEESGFIHIALCEKGQGKCPDLPWIDYRTDAMFMEGEK